MRVPGVAYLKFLWDNLLGLAYEAAHQGTVPGYNQMIEFVVRELVRETMRQLALEQRGGTRANLLDLAMDQVEQQGQELLAPLMDFSLNPYRASLRQSLKYPAKEMAELAVQLGHSRQQRVEETFHRSEAGLSFSIRAVGHSGAIEAFIAAPTDKKFGLELSRVKESCQVEGEWFPFQVRVGELQYTIDDDGLIYTCTANFPGGLMEQAREELLELANQIYETD